MKLTVIVLLLFTAAFAQAESYEDLIERAFESLEKNFADHWAYTETTENADGIFVASYDPRLPDADQWRLLSVDGRPPTDEDAAGFLERKGVDDGEDDDSGDEGVESMLAPGSAQLVEETDSFWLFNFRPAADSEEDQAFMDAVGGTLKVVKNGHYVAWIELQNHKPIKPGKGIKIDSFHTRLAFSPPYVGGPALPSGVTAEVHGRAFLVVKIDEAQKVSYSDFERVLE